MIAHPKILLAILALWLGGFFLFVHSIPSKVEDPTTITDAIVVLTGGGDRIKTGVTLLEQGLSKKLFISGVKKGVNFDILMNRQNIEKEVRQENISQTQLGYLAHNTEQNAKETSEWVKQQGGIQSLRLVTADFHINRSLLEFSRAFPTLKIIPHPVVSLKGPQGFVSYYIIIAEYHKFLFAWVKIKGSYLVENLLP
jgi:uncharacterized SAM-binding protein YcdF (DUF218 family)